MHWQPSELHRITSNPNTNIDDVPLHASAHSTSVEIRPNSFSRPPHSFLYATRLILSINIPKIDKELHYTYNIVISIILRYCSLIIEPLPWHCASFGYMQSPPPGVHKAQSSSVKDPVPHVSGQHRLISLAQVMQLSGKPARAFLHVRPALHSGEFFKHSSLSRGWQS